MRELLHLILPFVLLISIPTTSAQADDQIVCADSTLTTYLVSLIDALYANGLTTFEQLLANVCETDSGYALLDSWYSDQSLTLLPPTDAAFQAANIYPPFNGMSEDDMTNLVALHTLTGTWTYGNLPQSPMHGIAATQLSIAGHMNSSVQSQANQAMILQQGDNGAVSVRMANGNGTTWSGPIDLSASSNLGNLNVLPVDTVSRDLSHIERSTDEAKVIGFPPKLSTALTLPTTSRSSNGLQNMASALGSNGTTKLEVLTQGGFTIFVPVDDAWTAQIKGQLNNSGSAAAVLDNHVSFLLSSLVSAIDQGGTSIRLISAYIPPSSPSPALTPWPWNPVGTFRFPTTQPDRS